MMADFHAGERIKRIATGEAGTVISRDEDSNQIHIHAPNMTYTIQWDNGGQPEAMVRPDCTIE